VLTLRRLHLQLLLLLLQVPLLQFQLAGCSTVLPLRHLHLQEFQLAGCSTVLTLRDLQLQEFQLAGCSTVLTLPHLQLQEFQLAGCTILTLRHLQLQEFQLAGWATDLQGATAPRNLHSLQVHLLKLQDSSWGWHLKLVDELQVEVLQVEVQVEL
jgi:uncharacterized protein YceK